MGNPQPRVLPCGHVQLIKGLDRTTVEFDDARRYADELQRQIAAALEQAASN